MKLQTDSKLTSEQFAFCRINKLLQRALFSLKDCPDKKEVYDYVRAQAESTLDIYCPPMSQYAREFVGNHSDDLVFEEKENGFSISLKSGGSMKSVPLCY